MKAQTVRLLDVFVIGPVMIWGGWKLAKTYPVRGQFLAVSGAATIFYNGYNFFKVQRGERLTGGRADARRPADFDSRQLRLGTKVEMEHTNDPGIAREIAMDHLTEDSSYYDKLMRAGL